MIRPEWFAHMAPTGTRRWLVVGVVVLLLVLRHLVIRFLSRTNRRR